MLKTKWTVFLNFCVTKATDDTWKFKHLQILKNLGSTLLSVGYSINKKNKIKIFTKLISTDSTDTFRNCKIKTYFIQIDQGNNSVLYAQRSLSKIIKEMMI